MTVKKQFFLTIFSALVLAPGFLWSQTQNTQKAESRPHLEEKKSAPTGPTRVSIREYSKNLSRRAFAVSDLNRDDQITYLEARITLDVASPQAFRLWEKNKDGVIQFPEFDATFKIRVKSGPGIVLCGPAAKNAPEVEKKVNPRVANLFQDLDQNRDKCVSLKEWQGAAKELTSLLATIPGGFFRLDRDCDGKLLLKEFRVLQLLLPQLSSEVRQEAAYSFPYTLPSYLQMADKNSDQKLTYRETESLLRKIDPALALWTKNLLLQLDQNRDGEISPREVRKPILPASAKKN